MAYLEPCVLHCSLCEKGTLNLLFLCNIIQIHIHESLIDICVQDAQLDDKLQSVNPYMWKIGVCKEN